MKKVSLTRTYFIQHWFGYNRLTVWCATVIVSSAWFHPTFCQGFSTDMVHKMNELLIITGIQQCLALQKTTVTLSKT